MTEISLWRVMSVIMKMEHSDDSKQIEPKSLHEKELLHFLLSSQYRPCSFVRVKQREDLCSQIVTDL